MKTKIYEKSLGILEILTTSWKIYFKNFHIFCLIIFVTYFPFNIFSMYLIGYNTGRTKDLVLIAILLLMATIIAISSTAFAVEDSMSNKKATFGNALNKSLDRIPAFIMTSILYVLFLILFMIPGIIYSFLISISHDSQLVKNLVLIFVLSIPWLTYSVFWIFTLLAVILRNKSGKKALDYSKSIVKERWWKIFGYYLLLIIIPTLIVFLINLCSKLFFASLNDNIVFEITITTLLNFISVFFLVIFVVIFINFDATKKVPLDSKNTKKIKLW